MRILSGSSKAGVLLVSWVALLGVGACDGEGDLLVDLSLTSGVSCEGKGACDPGFLCFEDTWCVAEGALRISLSFDVDSDFDLHVISPDGQEIFWNNRAAGGGELDVDQCVNACGTGPHVENVYFANEPSDGTYEIYVLNYSGAGMAPRAGGPFRIEMAAGDQLATVTGSLEAEVGAESERFTLTWPSFATSDGGAGGAGGEGGAGSAGGN
jgi:hypothetical protein